MNTKKPSLWQRILEDFGWTRSSTFLLSLFFVTVLLIVVVWWPLAVDAFSTYNPNYPWWMQTDWLLIGNFLVMTILIVAGADLKTDALLLFVGLAGGLVIEGWGTQTELWIYYTLERPPLWIIPAWPIAFLSINRIVRLLDLLLESLPDIVFRVLYWIIFPIFTVLMLRFVWPTIDQSLTLMALLLCSLLIVTPTDHRLAVLTFIAGAGLGYFLERWGTTRRCWTYYTLERPPFFAVLAHGMAAVACWRSAVLLRKWHQYVPEWLRNKEIAPWMKDPILSTGVTDQKEKDEDL